MVRSRFELFVLSEGEKKITEKVVSGKLGKLPAVN